MTRDVIQFDNWSPDLPPYQSSLIQAKNCYPYAGFFRPFRDLSALSSSGIDAKPQGAIGFVDNRSDTPFVYVGNASKLYSYSGGSFTNKSKAGGYSTLSAERWEFAVYGDKTVATNYTDDLQVITNGGGGDFANLSGTPPKARHLAIVNNFLVCGNTNDEDGVVGNRIRWSAINDITAWTVGTNQSDYQDLEQDDGGVVRKIIGGSEYGIVIQEKAIQRMTYVGTPLVFRFDVLERNKGTNISGSVCSVGRNIFYIGKDSIYRFDGFQSVSISEARVNKFFFDNYDSNYPENVSASLDIKNNCILWSFPTVSSEVSGTPNMILCYNFLADRWSYMEISAYQIFDSITAATTLEDLDEIYESLDEIEVTLDSPSWQGGITNLNCFNSDYNLCSFEGNILTAEITSTELEFYRGRRTRLSKLRPLIDGGAATVSLGTRNLISGSVVFNPDSTQSASGNCAVRSNANYTRIKVKNTGNFNTISGVVVIEKSMCGNR